MRGPRVLEHGTESRPQRSSRCAVGGPPGLSGGACPTAGHDHTRGSRVTEDPPGGTGHLGGPLGKRLVITEKPSVARDIAAALGGFTEGEEFLENEVFVITWAVGHLLELADPKEYDSKWRSWSIKLLPILPERFEIKPKEGQKKRLAQIKKLGKRKDVDGLINACDAGREGELIYRRIVEHCGLERKPQQRLWLQSMTPAAIREAFDQLRDGAQMDNLADAAWLRSVGDWLIGMNATRALTQRLKSGGERSAWSAGRV
ncbi:MAG TPA: hypothetical protein ENK18_06690, partial [Deltaproteobacteria bacterium]|nr:hypothetical protein [Deltaproteobacteria bacterium]